MLTDNGAIFTAAARNGRCAIEGELDALGVLAKQPPPQNISELQAHLDRFAGYYNHTRPHRALGRRTPAQTHATRLKATPTRPGLATPAHYRVRHDKIDSSGVVTLRYRSRLHHIGIGRAHKHTRVLILVADLDIRIITQDGELLRHLTLDPTRDYQPIGTRDRP